MLQLVQTAIPRQEIKTVEKIVLNMKPVSSRLQKKLLEARRINVTLNLNSDFSCLIISGAISGAHGSRVATRRE